MWMIDVSVNILKTFYTYIYKGKLISRKSSQIATI